MKKAKDELTEKEFWNNYWNNIKLPQTVNPFFSFERCLANYFKKVLANSNKGNIIEIGCAPGKWMKFFQDLGFITYGIEYCIEAGIKTNENLKHLNSNAKVVIADFFNNTFKAKFDSIYSLGFVEHFTNVEKVIEDHFHYIKPDGFVVIGIPNFKGINYLIQRFLNPQIIEAHNLNCMNKEFFKNFALKNNLDIISLRYLGSFEPALFIGNSNKGLVNFIIMKTLSVLSKLRNKFTFLDNFNSRYWSSYLVCIYKKRCDQN
ncbi:MAG: class I SAM-dependent methyltransferase [Bacteroidales bacterium]|nr:class I SAM-dependent methyltransferase [Bacteroidales bacterium]